MKYFLLRRKSRRSLRSESEIRDRERRRLRIWAWEEVERINYLYPKGE